MMDSLKILLCLVFFLIVCGGCGGSGGSGSDYDGSTITVKNVNTYSDAQNTE